MTLITFTGIRIQNPLELRVDQVCIEDIAHSLSMICRFGGHCHPYYSVAEHCVRVSRSDLIPREYRLDALLHDAAEAYLGDLIRPVRACLPTFQALEDRLFAVIAERFGISPLPPKQIVEADNVALQEELAYLMHPALSVPRQFQLLSPGTAKDLFISSFNEYQASA